MDFADAVWSLQEQALMAHREAAVMFVNRYRGYALAYLDTPRARGTSVKSRPTATRT